MRFHLSNTLALEILDEDSATEQWRGGTTIPSVINKTRLDFVLLYFLLGGWLMYEVFPESMQPCNKLETFIEEDAGYKKHYT